MLMSQGGGSYGGGGSGYGGGGGGGGGGSGGYGGGGMGAGGYGAAGGSGGYGAAGGGGGGSVYGAASQEYAFETMPVGQESYSEQFAGSSNQPTALTSDGLQVVSAPLQASLANQAAAAPVPMVGEPQHQQLEAHFQLPERRRRRRRR